MANQKPSESDYERLGKSIEAVIASDFTSRKRLYWTSFSRGIFIGLGATIGGTLGIAFLVWLLSHFTQLPLIGDLVQTIENSLGQN